MVQESTLRVGVDSRPGVRGLRDFDTALDRTGSRSESLGQTFGDLQNRSNLLKKAFIGLAAASVAAVFTQAVTAAAAFETRMAEVSTLVDTTTFNIELLAGRLRELSSEFGSPATQQAAAAYQVISAGAGSATEAIELLDAANRLAIGGVTDVATAADGLTSVLNAYGMEAADAADVSDVLFVGMRAGKTTIGELSSTLGRVAPLAAQAGVGFDELVASIAALTKGGISTNEAVTGTRAILAAIVRPSSEAAQAAERLGIQFNAAALESQGLAGFMDNLVTATGGSTKQLAQFFGGVEALVPVLALAGQAGVDMTAILEDMEARGGATADAFEKMTNTFEFQSNRVREGLTNALSELGDTILTVLTPAMRFLADNMTEITQGIAFFAAGMTGLLLPAIVAVTVKLGLMAAAFLLTPFGLITAAIAAAAAALAIFGNTTITVGGQTVTVFQAIRAGIATAVEIIGEFGSMAASAFNVAVEAAGSFFQQVVGWFGGFEADWSGMLNTVLGLIRSAVNSYIGLFLGIGVAIGPAITEGIPALFNIAMGIALNAVITGIQNIVNAVVNGLGGVGDALGLIPGVADDLGDSIRGALTIDLSSQRADVDALRGDLAAARDAVTGAFGDQQRDYVGEFGAVLGEVSSTIGDRYNANLTEMIETTGTSAEVTDESTAAMDALLESLNNGTEGTENLAGAQRGGAAAGREMNEVLKRQRDLLQEITTPGAEAQQRIQDLNTLFEAGQISAGTLNRELVNTRLELMNLNAQIGEGGMAEGFLMELGRMTEGVSNFRVESGQIFGQFFDNFSKGFADSIGQAIWDTDNLGESLKRVARQAISQLISSFIQLGIQMLANKVLGATLGASATAASAAQAGALASAWAPAAALASLATSGANSAGASAAVSGVMGLTKSLAAVGGAFADGGLVGGRGGPRSDLNLAAVSRGEYIVNAAATRRNLGALEAMNNGGELMPRGGGTVIMNIQAPDADSFQASESQVKARMAMGLERAERRNR